jgi:hypothetical protein
MLRRASFFFNLIVLVFMVKRATTTAGKMAARGR